MLVIRREQFLAFEKHMQKQRVQLHAEAMHVAWPDACAQLGDDGVRACVEQALDGAAARGFTDTAGETRFLHLHFLWGADVAEQPWAKAILAWPLEAELRLDALEKRARMEVAKRAGN